MKMYFMVISVLFTNYLIWDLMHCIQEWMKEASDLWVMGDAE